MGRLKENSRNSTYGNDWPEARGYSWVDSFDDMVAVAEDEEFTVVQAPAVPKNDRVHRFDEFKNFHNRMRFARNSLRKEEREAEREAWQESMEHMRHLKELEGSIHYDIAEEQHDIARTVLLAAYSEHYHMPYAGVEPNINEITQVPYLGKLVYREMLDDELRESFRLPKEHARHTTLLERLGEYITSNYGALREEILDVPI